MTVDNVCLSLLSRIHRISGATTKSVLHSKMLIGSLNYAFVRYSCLLSRRRIIRFPAASGLKHVYVPIYTCLSPFDRLHLTPDSASFPSDYPFHEILVLSGDFIADGVEQACIVALDDGFFGVARKTFFGKDFFGVGFQRS